MKRETASSRSAITRPRCGSWKPRLVSLDLRRGRIYQFNPLAARQHQHRGVNLLGFAKVAGVLDDHFAAPFGPAHGKDIVIAVGIVSQKFRPVVAKRFDGTHSFYELRIIAQLIGDFLLSELNAPEDETAARST